MPFPVAAAIAGAAQIASNAINASASGNMNRKNRAFQREVNAQNRAWSLEDWNMQNEYNSPTAQMARFKAAGLNPNLIYGQTNTADGVRNAPAGANEGKPFHLDTDIGSNTVAAYQNAKLQDETLKNMETQRTVMLADVKQKEAATLNTLAQTDLTRTNIARGEFDLALQNSLRGYNVAAAELANIQTSANIGKTQADTQFTKNHDARAEITTRQGLRESIARIAQMAVQNAKTRQETQNASQTGQMLLLETQLKRLELNLKEMGIQPTDNMLFRMFGQLMNGGKLEDIFQAIKDKGINNF